MIGVFVSLDTFLFYVFWEVMLIPMYFLIGIWGGENRLYAAIKFFLYTLVGSVVMLLGVLTRVAMAPSLMPRAVFSWLFAPRPMLLCHMLQQHALPRCR
jgi:NADH:ubiquinone oxidoreductase subunit 4 (subunit M)